MTGFTVEEQVISVLAQIYRGEVIAAAATVSADIAARLAKALYAPEIVLMAGGSMAGFDCAPTAKGLNDEWISSATAVRGSDWIETFDLISAGKYAICMGPVQVDRTGSCNISVLGDWERPKVAMIGSRGIPDDLVRLSELTFHVRRHTPRALVERVDFRCGLGFGPDRDRLGLTMGEPRMLVTDLGVFDFDRDGAGMRVRSLHPGVSFGDVVKATGFELLPPRGAVPVTPPPTEEELYWIRERLDPLGVRRLDSPEPPPGLLAELAERERSLWTTPAGGAR
ncbi:CoA-transferase [Amycolatopsis alkalitolerans]|uniref:CoA-transferase n=1 Tax=Amycolatopsis alkalitolerans TaxID=2547244 RepID=A0A5C4M7C7_9PSEU|nr:CoA-transferase [Amycolatopsis alkalitolerans]TNC29184.1 CoA-transferase [Amycolatopsis alkalitolerans]